MAISVFRSVWSERVLSILIFLYSGALFYGGWIYCVWGATQGDGLLPPLVTWGLVGVQLGLTYVDSKAAARTDVVLIVLTCLFGFALETVFIFGGVATYAAPNEVRAWMAPFWVVTVYALLAVCLNHSLVWLKSMPLLAAFLGAASAFLCYGAVERAGAVSFSIAPLSALGCIALVWFLAFPALLRMASRL